MALDGDVQALEPDVRDDDDNIEGEYEHEPAVADVVLAELRDLSETRKLHLVDAADTSCSSAHHRYLLQNRFCNIATMTLDGV